MQNLTYCAHYVKPDFRESSREPSGVTERVRFPWLLLGKLIRSNWGRDTLEWVRESSIVYSLHWYSGITRRSLFVEYTCLTEPHKSSMSGSISAFISHLDCLVLPMLLQFCVTISTSSNKICSLREEFPSFKRNFPSTNKHITNNEGLPYK